MVWKLANQRSFRQKKRWKEKNKDFSSGHLDKSRMNSFSYSSSSFDSSFYLQLQSDLMMITGIWYQENYFQKKNVAVIGWIFWTETPFIPSPAPPPWRRCVTSHTGGGPTASFDIIGWIRRSTWSMESPEYGRIQITVTHLNKCWKNGDGASGNFHFSLLSLPPRNSGN